MMVMTKHMSAPAAFGVNDRKEGSACKNGHNGFEDDLKEKEAAALSLREFTKESTLHGIKYVFDDTSYIRKGFWLMIILGSLLFFLVQVGLRVSDYYRYQTVTSVKRINTNQLKFPAVTFCNLNRFRISKAYDDGLYEYLYQQVSTKNEIVGEIPENLNDTKAAIMRLGHQLQQLVDSCRWQGQPCNMSHDFLVRILDVGLCYTFNFGSDRKIIHQAGIDGGLELFLNIEQYEHMRGLNKDMGVKFLLHDADEIPSLRNHGFVANPGQHTFVSIKLTAVRSLPEPWGKCSPEGKSITECKHNCWVQDFRKHCNCSDVTILPDDEWPTCKMTTQFSCGCTENNTDSSQCGASCSCESPCSEDIYRPSLSSSTLSAINLDMFALTAPGVKQSTNKTFLHASEVRLLVSADFETDYRQPMQTIIHSLHSLVNVTQNLNQSLPTAYLTLLDKFADSYYQSLSDYDPVILLETKKSLLGKDSCGDNTEKISDFLFVMAQLTEALVQLAQLKYGEDGEYGTLCDWQTHWGFLLDEQNVAVTQFSSGLASSSYTGECNVLDASFSHTCSSMPAYINCISYTAGYIYGKLSYFQEFPLLQNYSRDTRSLYESHYLIYPFTDVTHTPEYMECMNYTDIVIADQNILHGLANTLGNLFIVNLSSNISSETFDEMLDVAFNYINKSELTLHNIYKKRYYADVCCYLDSYLHLETSQTGPDGTETVLTGVQHEQYTYDQLVYYFQSLAVENLVAVVGSLKTSALPGLLEPLSDIVFLIDEYLLKEMSTRTLASELSGQYYYRQISAIISNIELDLTRLTSINRVLNSWLTNMLPYLDILFNQRLMQLTSNADAVNTRLYSFLRSDLAVQGQERLSRAAAPACNDPLVHLKYSPEMQLFIRLSCGLIYALNDDITTLMSVGIDFEISAYGLIETLKQYYSDTQMNNIFHMENFMQVDLYYEDLQYEVMEEQKAFVLGSLFSEVGGFLGLLLGASIMTVCELIDYLLLVVTRRLNKQNKAEHINQIKISPQLS